MHLPPFESLIEAHAAELHRFLCASIGPVEADDCLQDTLLAALRHYPRLRDATNLRAWLYTIAQRKATDLVRRTRRRPTAELDGHEPRVEPHVFGDDGLWAAVRELPPKQRAAVVHRFVFDLAYAEVGVRMATTEEAARRNVHEGITKLRRMVNR